MPSFYKFYVDKILVKRYIGKFATCMYSRLLSNILSVPKALVTNLSQLGNDWGTCGEAKKQLGHVW